MKLPDLFDMSDPPAPDALPVDVLGNHAAALHVSGEWLDPDTVSNLFRVSPTSSEAKGVPLVRKDGSEERIATAGLWTLGIPQSAAGAMNYNEAIEALLGLLPEDLATWKKVGALGTMHISLNLAIDAGNGEIWLEPPLLAFLGERNVGLHVEIYLRDSDLGGAQYY